MEGDHILTRNRFTIRDIVIIGMMSALTFLGVYFLRIDFAIPGGRTMIHFGNAFCIISAILFGGVCGGLSGGIGMALFDLTSGNFVAYAPFTFILKFIVGFVCGKIAFIPIRSNPKEYVSVENPISQSKRYYLKSVFSTPGIRNDKYIPIAVVSALAINVIGSPLINIIVKVLIYGVELQTALITSWANFLSALINGIIMAAICIPLANFIKKFF